MAHTSWVELQIVERVPASGAEPGSYDGSTDDVQYKRKCLLALGACTSALLGIPPPRFLGISFLQREQLAGCCASLSRLGHIHADDGAYRGPGQVLVDLPVLLDRASQQLTKTASEALEADDGTFTLLASRLRALQAKLKVSSGGGWQQSGMNGAAQGGVESSTAAARPFRPSQGPFQNPRSGSTMSSRNNT